MRRLLFSMCFIATIAIVSSSIVSSCNAQSSPSPDALLAEAQLRYENILQAKHDVLQAFEVSSQKALQDLEKELASTELLRRIEESQINENVKSHLAPANQSAVSPKQQFPLPLHLPAVQRDSQATKPAESAPHRMLKHDRQAIEPHTPTSDARSRDSLSKAQARLRKVAEELLSIANDLSERVQNIHEVPQ
jgi:hypothetical protein